MQSQPSYSSSLSHFASSHLSDHPSQSHQLLNGRDENSEATTRSTVGDRVVGAIEEFVGKVTHNPSLISSGHNKLHSLLPKSSQPNSPSNLTTEVESFSNPLPPPPAPTHRPRPLPDSPYPPFIGQFADLNNPPPHHPHLDYAGPNLTAYYSPPSPLSSNPSEPAWMSSHPEYPHDNDVDVDSNSDSEFEFDEHLSPKPLSDSTSTLPTTPIHHQHGLPLDSIAEEEVLDLDEDPMVGIHDDDDDDVVGGDGVEEEMQGDDVRGMMMMGLVKVKNIKGYDSHGGLPTGPPSPELGKRAQCLQLLGYSRTNEEEAEEGLWVGLGRRKSKERLGKMTVRI